MNVARRQKFMNNGSRTVSFSDKKVEIVFDIGMLDLMCSYVLSENRTIKKSQLINMRNLFECIDLELYRTDIEKKKRIDFIRKGLEGRILRNLKEYTLILQYINGGFLDTNNLDVDITSATILNSDEMHFINETVSSALKYTFIYNDVDRMYSVLTRFKAADYVSKQYMVNELEGIIADMQNKFRRVRADSTNELEFRLKPEILEDSFRDIYDKLTNPSSKLVTGWQGFNEMLGGGFFGTRLYMLLGLTGGGKSLTLLDICLQLKKYNKNFKCKDPSKKPCIVYLTMENTVEETVERLFEMSTGREIQGLSFEEALHLLVTDGELYLSDESPIDIIIRYKANKSVDTGYLYEMTEDLEDEGMEVIAVVQDHIGRMRSTQNLTETRLELGTVANEMKTFSQLKEIPFITNFHLNREAAAKIDEATNCNKSDLIRVLGRANVAESQVMINNIDGCYMINQEWDQNGNKWLGVMRTKKRFKASDRAVIFMPYTSPNSPKLLEDYYATIPVFRDSLRENVIGYNQPQKKSNNKIQPNPYNGNIRSIDEVIGSQNKFVDTRTEINIFDIEKLADSSCGHRADLVKDIIPLKKFMTRVPA